MKFEMVISLKTPRSLGLKDVSAVRADANADSVTYVEGLRQGPCGCASHECLQFV